MYFWIFSSFCFIFKKMKFFICLTTEISYFQENNGVISEKFKFRKNKKKTVLENLVAKLCF